MFDYTIEELQKIVENLKEIRKELEDLCERLGDSDEEN